MDGIILKERMAMGVVEAIYKLKYLIFCQPKKYRDNGKNTGETQGIWYQLERGNPDTPEFFWKSKEISLSCFVKIYDVKYSILEIVNL